MWATNSTLETHHLRLVLTCFDLESDWVHEEAHEVTLNPNQSTELLTTKCPCPPSLTDQKHPCTTSSSVVVGARLISPDSDEVIARTADWPQPFRHNTFPDPGLRIDVDNETLTINVDRPAKCVFFAVDDPLEAGEVKWSDNALDLLPGDTQIVHARELRGRPVTVAYLGKECRTVV